MKEKLKIPYILIAFIIFCFKVNCQICRVTYVYQPLEKPSNQDLLTKNFTFEQRKLLEKMIKNTQEQEFELIFDKNSSIYRSIQKLPQGDDDEVLSGNTSLNRQYYKSNVSQEKIRQEILDNLYNISLPFNQYKWDISTETKIISGYKCYKATTIHQDSYNPITKRQLSFTPVVWFCPEIASTFGPQGLDGLPGLVLQGTLNGKLILYVSKIEFDIKNETKIEKPKCFKTITVKELEDLMMAQQVQRERDDK